MNLTISHQRSAWTRRRVHRAGCHGAAHPRRSRSRWRTLPAGRLRATPRSARAGERDVTKGGRPLSACGRRLRSGSGWQRRRFPFGPQASHRDMAEFGQPLLAGNLLDQSGALRPAVFPRWCERLATSAGFGFIGMGPGKPRIGFIVRQTSRCARPAHRRAPARGTTDDAESRIDLTAGQPLHSSTAA